MKATLQEQLVERVLAHVEKRSTDTAPLEGRAAVESYLSPSRLEQEQKLLFRGLPLIVGHRAMTPSPGDFITRDAAGVPLLIVRGDDGRARVFLNVCRHRGTILENAESGCERRSFVCPYHGWTYGRDGALNGVPHSGGFPSARQGLVELPAAEISGLLFTRLTPGGEAAVPAHFSQIEDDLNGWDLASHHVYSRHSFERAMNWKLVVDIFLETYHLRVAHEKTIAELFFDNLGLVDIIGPHTRNVFAKRSIKTLVDKPRSEWRIRDHANVLYFVFPNTFMLFEPDHLALMQVYPLGLDRARIESAILIPAPAKSVRARAYWDANVRILFDAIEEDFALGESIQRGLASGANASLNFGRFEHALTGFHQALAGALGPINDRCR